MKKFRLYFLLIFLAELLSFSEFLFPELRQVAFFTILIIALILSLQKLEYGLLILLAELFIGSKGYLFYFEQGGFIISIRIALFLVVMAVWLAKLIILWSKQGLAGAIEKLRLPFWQYYILLGAAIGWGIVNGYFNGNEFSNVFFDANSWLYWLIIFPLAYALNERSKNGNKFWQELFAVFSAAVIWLCLETLFLLFAFSHNLIIALYELYPWIRITGAGEVTVMESDFVRIFFQSQIYALIALMIFTSLIVYFKSAGDKKKLLYCCIAILLSTSAVIISFSRSFWIGLAAGLLFYCFIFFLYFKQNWKELFWQVSVLFSIAALSVLLIFAIVKFPYPKPTANFDLSLLTERASSISGEAGASSRWNLLPPLWEKIKQAPILGQGFGATVTYKTQDPRVLEQNPSGEYTTYAFEWGYLDIWLKLGLLGLAVYLILLVKIFYNGIKNFQFSIPRTRDNFQSLLNIALLAGLVTIMTTSFFSPYLNHPLGIGYVVLLSILLKK
ncbi:hypothetical protein COU00_01545 [Candidatus Falkowbacteria bacterium CG10_big_fil_rev_8_21_14_0_10_43_11]|uniref:O-antigen ligase-related domain-containing protein n=1 Tax=Candidatus Falkowbacteria bacterium CG10_big_fil_rev_8_21_14_0_10_43_11 TaxID=1974568 RepID=A0A2M6WME6_9BACT|nr:MAG: hypothetical protein COU00_01545 [Candidatus Falkowbacteria bacterium CG10_big_fil_rev_8_21_14_0_10_43_11]